MNRVFVGHEYHLERSSIVGYQAEIMRSGCVPQLQPVIWIDRGEFITMRYLPSASSLRTVLQQTDASSRDMLSQWRHKIDEAARIIDDFMLSPSQLVYHVDRIYVHGHGSEQTLSFQYLPTETPCPADRESLFAVLQQRSEERSGERTPRLRFQGSGRVEPLRLQRTKIGPKSDANIVVPAATEAIQIQKKGNGYMLITPSSRMELKHGDRIPIGEEMAIFLDS